MSERHQIDVTVNGKRYHVVVENGSTSPLRVNVNGQPYEVFVEGLRDGLETAAPRIRPVAHATRPASVKKEGAAEDLAVQAPIPGTIVDIAVKVGDRVKTGQVLCTLEAMKMQNAIRAARDGVISGVLIAPGQVVVHGEILFAFEQ